jgi:methionine sulfoxide reductase heme-binding subunit
LNPARTQHFPQWLIHVAALTPLLWLAGGFLVNGWGINPIQYLERRSGDYALALLLASLACTPLRIITNSARFTQFRKPLGLYAFAYAALHLLLFIGLDYGFAWTEIIPLILNKTYLWLGLAAFVMLLLLAVTSTQGWQRRLKKNWQRLHALVFLTGGLVVLHFALSKKGNLFTLSGEELWPLLSLIVLAVLLLIRFKPIRSAIKQLHR